MAITQTYVDYGAGVDAPGGGGIGNPWKTLQYAFNNLVRNVADGNQVNLKAGTAHINAAALDLTTFIAGGALSAVAPLIVRGYTAAANDGGIGEIDCGGTTMWAAATYDYIILADLELHSFGNNHGINLDTNITLFRCEVHKGASSPAAKYLVNLTTSASVLGCYLHDAGTGAGRCLTETGYSRIFGNYVVPGAITSYAIATGTTTMVIGNVVSCASADTSGIYVNTAGTAIHNAVYNSGAGTGRGLHVVGTFFSLTMNNIIEGWSGVGGDGIESVNNGFLGFNAFYNNTANNTVTDQKFIDLTANDVLLAASPFTSPATGDFSLMAAAKAALRDVGWPVAYLGAHANTDGHITIGSIQYGPAVVGGMVRIMPAPGRLM